jgi:hypothetical protein
VYYWIQLSKKSTSQKEVNVGKRMPIDTPAKLIVNHKLVEYTDYSDQLQYLLMMGLDFKHAPYGDKAAYFHGDESYKAAFDKLKHDLISVFDIFIDFCECRKEALHGLERAELTRLMKSVNSYKTNWFKGNATIATVTKHYWDLIMTLQKLGPLHGFGARTNFGDTLYGDPESVYIYDLNSRL